MTHRTLTLAASLCVFLTNYGPAYSQSASQDTSPSTSSVFTGGEDVVVVAATIRHYKSNQLPLDAGDNPQPEGWYLIKKKPGSGHDPVLIAGVEQSSATILKLATGFLEAGFRPDEWTPSGFVVGPDETLARSGIVVGGSVGTRQIKLLGSVAMERPILVRRRGDGWRLPKQYTANWEDGRLRVQRRPQDYRLGVARSTYGDSTARVTLPASMADAGISMAAVDPDGRDGFYIKFYRFDGTSVDEPFPKMSFNLSDPYVLPPLLNFDAAAHKFSNFWMVGIFVRK